MLAWRLFFALEEQDTDPMYLKAARESDIEASENLIRSPPAAPRREGSRTSTGARKCGAEGGEAPRKGHGCRPAGAARHGLHFRDVRCFVLEVEVNCYCALRIALHQMRRKLLEVKCFVLNLITFLLHIATARRSTTSNFLLF